MKERSIATTSAPRSAKYRPHSGPAQLLQQVYFGTDVYTNQVLSRQESVLDPVQLESARRITATHLPYSPENEGWLFDAALTEGALISATVITPYNDQQSNPFLHTYHPDHDNLDGDFANELPQGSESYEIERTIRLQIDPAGTNFSDRVTGGQTRYGSYQETLKLIGMDPGNGEKDTRTFEMRGAFRLDRISTIPELTNPL